MCVHGSVGMYIFALKHFLIIADNSNLKPPDTQFLPTLKWSFCSWSSNDMFHRIIHVLTGLASSVTWNLHFLTLPPGPLLLSFSIVFTQSYSTPSRSSPEPQHHVPRAKKEKELRIYIPALDLSLEIFPPLPSHPHHFPSSTHHCSPWLNLILLGAKWKFPLCPLKVYWKSKTRGRSIGEKAYKFIVNVYMRAFRMKTQRCKGNFPCSTKYDSLGSTKYVQPCRNMIRQKGCNLTLTDWVGIQLGLSA